MTGSAKLLSGRPTLIVPDVKAAAEYYRDRLGFEIDGIWGTGYAIVNRGGAVIHFAGMADEMRGVKSPQPNTDYTCRWTMWDIYFHTDDIASLFEELKAKGADIFQGPYDADHGNREIHVRDLNGYVLAFGQDLDTL